MHKNGNIGIMFAAPGGDFPTVRSFGFTSDAVDEFDDWLVVAYDPRPLMYGDEDSETMDETNFAVVLDVVGEVDAVDNYYRSDDRHRAMLVGLGRERGALLADVWMGYGSQRCLIVAPEAFRGEEAMEQLDELRECSRSLESYPLLDEDAYSEREYAAWMDNMADGLKFDTLQELDTLDDETSEALDESWADVAGRACEHLHYYSGFTGEHGPNFGECIGNAISDALIAVSTLGQFSHWHRVRN